MWWGNQNIKDQPSCFAICTQKFGGVSSGSCSNYALKGTATDNTDQYGQAAAKIMESNFYEDYLLKSVDDSGDKCGRHV